MKRSKGFTLLEMLIVLAILGILTAIAIPSYARYSATQEVLQAQQSVIQQINLARSGAKRASQNYWAAWTNDQWGTQLEVVRKFGSGTTYDAAQDTKTTLVLPTTIKMNGLTSSGSAIDKIWYSAPYGRKTVSDVQINLVHKVYSDIQVSIRVVGVTGKVVRLERS